VPRGVERIPGPHLHSFETAPFHHLLELALYPPHSRGRFLLTRGLKRRTAAIQAVQNRDHVPHDIHVPELDDLFEALELLVLVVREIRLGATPAVQVLVALPLAQ